MAFWFDVHRHVELRAAEESTIATETIDRRSAALHATQVVRRRFHLGFRVAGVFHRRFERGLKWTVEPSKQLLPLFLARLNLVQASFHLAGVAYVHDFRKSINQFVGDNFADVRRL